MKLNTLKISIKRAHNPTLNELLYFTALIFELVAMLVSLTTLKYTYPSINVDKIAKLFRYIGYCLVAIKIINCSYTKKEFIIQAIIILILGVGSFYSGRTQFLSFLFIYGMKNIDYEAVIKKFSIIYSIGLIIIILSVYTGVLQNWDYNSVNRIRSSLGFTYPSVATSAILYTILSICYVLKNKLKVWHVVLLETLNFVQYKITDSRTGFAIIAMMIVIFYLLRYLKNSEKRKINICRFLSYSFIVSAIISVASALLYNSSNQMWVRLNSFVSDRISLSNKAISTYGIHLFGKKIIWVGYAGLGHSMDTLPSAYNYVDCSYVKILLEYGVIFFVIVIIGFTLASKFAVKEKNIYLSVSLTFIAVYSIIEPRLCEIGYNPFYFLLVLLFENPKYLTNNRIWRRIHYEKLTDCHRWKQ